MRSTPLAVRALALILCSAITAQAGPLEAARVTPESGSAPSAAGVDMSLPALQITATFGTQWPTLKSTDGLVPTNDAASAAARIEAQAAAHDAAASGAASQTSGGTAGVTETTRLASERVHGVLVHAQTAFAPTTAVSADIKGEAAKAREPVLRLSRPAADATGRAASQIEVAEPASKKVSELRNRLLNDHAAGLAEAQRRLSDPTDARVEIRVHAGRVIAEHAGDEATGVLARSLVQEQHWYARRELAFALGNRASRQEPDREQAIAALQGALADANDSIHLMAHWALRQFGVDPGTERALVIPQEPPPPPPTRWERVKTKAKKVAAVTAVVGVLGVFFGGGIAISIAHPEYAQQAQFAEAMAWNGSIDFPNIVPVAQAAEPAAQAAAVKAEAPPKQAVPAVVVPAKDPMVRIADAIEAQTLLQAKQAADAETGRTSMMFMFLGFIVLSVAGPLLTGWFMNRKRTKDGAKPKDDQPKQDPSGMLKANVKKSTGGDASFSDLAGIENAMGTMNEVVDYLRNPLEFKARGGKMPKGLLLVGPPGTGKTAIARALASEADVPFFSISGSDFVEMFVGVGASRVRDLFAQAKAAGRAIIFIDEIDAVGKARSNGGPGGNDEREQTLNQLLVEMDGFAAESGILLIGATNRPDTLDPALLRPGRFNRQVQVNPADVIGREAQAVIHARNVPLAPDVDLKQVAERSPGRSGAFMMNFVNEAALNATKYRRRAATAKDFDVGLTRAIIGDENPLVMDEAEKLRTSYHEAGHVFGGQILNKVTIIPHGPALGYAEPAEEIQRFNMTKKQAMDTLVIALAGRVAEEIAFGHVEDEESSAGASNDFERATELARNMVQRWGMSKELGFMVTAPPANQPYAQVKVSELTQQQIDAAIKDLLQRAHDIAEKKLRARWSDLEAMALDLMKHETLYRQDIERYTKPHQVQ